MFIQGENSGFITESEGHSQSYRRDLLCSMRNIRGTYYVDPNGHGPYKQNLHFSLFPAMNKSQIKLTSSSGDKIQVHPLRLHMQQL